MKIDIEGVESSLSLCIKTLKILHPIMNKDEPCIAYEAYESAKWALRHLASQQCLSPKCNCNGNEDGVMYVPGAGPWICPKHGQLD